jgi:hypothetical protein
LPIAGQVIKFSDGIFAEQRSSLVDINKPAVKLNNPEMSNVDMTVERHDYFSKNYKTVMIGLPPIFSNRMVEKISEYLYNSKSADAAYLLWMISGYESSYLFVINSKRSLKELYDSIGELCRPHLMYNYFEIIPFDSPLAQSVIKGKTPFYTKKLYHKNVPEGNFAFDRSEDRSLDKSVEPSKDFYKALRQLSGNAYAENEMLLSYAIKDWMSIEPPYSSERIADLKSMLRKYNGGRSAVVENEVAEYLRNIDVWLRK